MFEEKQARIPAPANNRCNIEYCIFTRYSYCEYRGYGEWATVLNEGCSPQTKFWPVNFYILKSSKIFLVAYW